MAEDRPNPNITWRPCVDQKYFGNCNLSKTPYMHNNIIIEWQQQDDSNIYVFVILAFYLSLFYLVSTFFPSELRQNGVLISKFSQNSIRICGILLPLCFTSHIPTFCLFLCLHCLQYIFPCLQHQQYICCWPKQMYSIHSPPYIRRESVHPRQEAE